MAGVNTTECIICYNEYDTDTRKPCIGTCGHSICEGCKHQMASSKCPQCNREEAFAITTINYQVLELIKHFKNMQAGESNSTRGSLDDSKNFEEGACSECTLRSRKLRICVTCALQAGVLITDTKKKKPVLNVQDGDIEAAMDRAKSIAICGDCALDGPNHEGHKTMQLAVLRENLEDRAVATVDKKIEEIAEKAQRVIKELNNKFMDNVSSLKSYFALYATLKAGPEQKVHLNNVEASLEQINNTISMVEDCGKRLDFLHKECQDHTSHVQETKRVVSKSATIFASADPVLVADRKQSAKEPLLIGVFNPLQRTWQPVGRMPNPKSNYAVASNRSQIYIVGGMNNGAWLNSLEMYDRDKNLRRDCNRMRRGRTRTSAGFHNGKLYVSGGYDGGYLNSVEIYDPENCDWKEGPQLQRARADSSIVSCNGELYVLGGFNGKEYEEKIEKLNETTHKFELIGDMQGSRAGFGSCGFKGRIYIAGGWSSSSNTLKSVRSYDPLTKTWRDEPSLNKDRKYFTLHATNEAVYAIRGCADSWSLINEVERLDSEKGKWEIISCNNPPTGPAAGGGQQGASTSST